MRDGNTPERGGPTTKAWLPSFDKTTTSEHCARSGPHSTLRVMDDAPLVEVPEPASVHVILTRSRVRIVVSGEVDADLVGDLTEAADDAEATGLPIEVDAQHVTFMDSSGIAFLARLTVRSPERVRVLHAPEAVRFLLEITRIGEMLDLIDEADEAGPEPELPRPEIVRMPSDII